MPQLQLFVSGHNNPVQFTVYGAGNVSTLDVTGHNFDEEVNRIIVTNSASGGVAARLANVLDIRGNVTAFYDLLKPPYINPPYIQAGISGNFFMYLSGAAAALRYFQIPAIIAKVHYESQVMGGVQWNFDFECNSIVGTYTRPAT